MKETTYNKYKRENKQLKSIINIELQDFVLNTCIKKFKERRNEIKRFIKTHRLRK